MQTRRHNRNLAVHRAEVHSLTRDEKSELPPFPVMELTAKPLVAFEAAPADTAPPVTWASSSA
jgi:hypothetical protein